LQKAGKRNLAWQKGSYAVHAMVGKNWIGFGQLGEVDFYQHQANNE